MVSVSYCQILARLRLCLLAASTACCATVLQAQPQNTPRGNDQLNPLPRVEGFELEADADQAPVNAWEFIPRLQLSQIYTDNVGLDIDAEAESDLVTEFAPGFEWRVNTSRITGNVDYQFQNLIYQDNDDSNEIFHQLESDATVELIRQALFVDLQANYYQQLFTPDISFNQRNINTLNNSRSDVTELRASPYWLHRVQGADIDSILRYSAASIDYEENAANRTNLDSQLQAVQWQLGNFFRRAQGLNDNRLNRRSSGGLEWLLNAQFTEIEFDENAQLLQNTREFRRIDLTLAYPISSDVELLATVGFEDNDFAVDDDLDDPTGTLWLAGLTWTPTSRDSITFRAGQRYFGDTYEFSWRHVARKWQISATYDEELLTDIQTNITGVSLDNNGQFNGLVTRPTNEVFLRQRGSLRIRYDWSKTVIDLNAFYEDQIFQRVDDDESILGFRASLSWAFGARTRLVGTFDRRERDLIRRGAILVLTPLDRDRIEDDRLDLLELSMVRDIGETAELNVYVGRAERSNASNNDGYTENFMGVTLVKFFE